MNDPLPDPIPPDKQPAVESSKGAFAETRWTLVRMLSSDDPRGAEIAMEQLCRIYWYPIYAFIRRKRSCSHQDAEDLTQSFFAHLLSNNTLLKASEEEGKFRSYLLAALDNLLHNERDWRMAQKRGGGQEILSLDWMLADEMFSREPSEAATDERYYDRVWALTLVRQSLARQRKTHEENGRSFFYNTLEPYLNGRVESGSHARSALLLGMSENAVKTALSRLRKDFRKTLRSEVAQTVSDPSQVEEELRYLLEVLTR